MMIITKPTAMIVTSRRATIITMIARMIIHEGDTIRTVGDEREVHDAPVLDRTQ
jgi:hypothetical protein